MSKSHFLSLRKMRGWQEISCEHSERASVSRVPGSALCQRSGANQPRCLVTQLNNKQFQGQRWVWAHWGPHTCPQHLKVDWKRGPLFAKRALVCWEYAGGPSIAQGLCLLAPNIVIHTAAWDGQRTTYSSPGSLLRALFPTQEYIPLGWVSWCGSQEMAFYLPVCPSHVWRGSAIHLAKQMRHS